MSADRPEEFVDDGERDGRPDLPEPVPDDAPIRAIAPDDFVARSSASTFRAALRKLERETSRPPAAFPRCPECGSIQIQRKRGVLEMPQRRDGAFKCRGCGEHFDDPDPPREAEAPGEQATLREVTRG